MPKKIEETQYVCLCGETTFIIRETYIECAKCGVQYFYYHGYLLNPTSFNGRRESFKRKVK